MDVIMETVAESHATPDDPQPKGDYTLPTNRKFGSIIHVVADVPMETEDASEAIRKMAAESADSFAEPRKRSESTIIIQHNFT